MLKYLLSQIFTEPRTKGKEWEFSHDQCNKTLYATKERIFKTSL